MAIKLKNNTGSFSKLGHLVSIDPRDSNAFVYALPNSTRVLGVICESVPYRSSCKIATQGETAKVFVMGNVVKNSPIRLSKSTDRASLGTAVIAKSGDSPYLKIGDALNSGRGLIPIVLELFYQGNADEDSGYVPYTGATTDLNLGTHEIYASGIHVDDLLQEDGDALLTEAGHNIIQ